jgi:hypothetical protein
MEPYLKNIWIYDYFIKTLISTLKIYFWLPYAPQNKCDAVPLNEYTPSRPESYVPSVIVIW